MVVKWSAYTSSSLIIRVWIPLTSISLSAHITKITNKIKRMVMALLINALWSIFCALGNFLKPLATINLPKSLTLLGNFCKGVKIYHFLVKSFLGNFYRHLAIFFWSHWCCRYNSRVILTKNCLDHLKSLPSWFSQIKNTVLWIMPNSATNLIVRRTQRSIYYQSGEDKA